MAVAQRVAGKEARRAQALSPAAAPAVKELAVKEPAVKELAAKEPAARRQAEDLRHFPILSTTGLSTIQAPTTWALASR
jgi:hypothetical protein